MLKRLTFLSVLVLVVLVWGWPAMAAEPAEDRADNIAPYGGAKAEGDILWCCPIEWGTDNQILGCEALGDTIYTTSAGGSTSPDPNYVYAWLRTATDCVPLYNHPQPTTSSWGWRDMGCDGEYLYASDDRTLEAFYMTPGGLVLVPGSNITISGMADISTIRCVAYDAGHDWFWTADFSSNIYAFDRTGAMVAGPYANSLDLYGMAFDGTYLWCHSQDGTKVNQFDINTGAYTGVVYAGCDDATGGIAGGLSLLDVDQGKQTVTLLGITQSSPDALYAMELYVHEEEWPNHKMHFPQLPDEIGWDVLSTAPIICADDWQCSETGWVTDIHFWGSWKNDDFPPGGEMPQFALFILRNIPADIDTPWSRPGEVLWEWWGEIPGTPFDPPTYEGWYDPITDSSFCNDHTSYWRYDFFVNDPTMPPADSFFQYQDSIYWLAVATTNINPPYQWGWKNSRDHFMDDAVYSDDPYQGPWFEMYEPPRCNWFDVYFDSSGYPNDMGSTNYYGQGWYFYEMYQWWNMWFYNNPFTYTNPKHIWLEFYVEPVGPQAYAEFAINWSTDIWSMEGEPGRPPLPQDGNEDLFIGRSEQLLYPGWNEVDFWINEYNPEWVSVDFRAVDVMINGFIWHECVGTSLDLAFVITGVPGEPPVVCGDVNNNGVVDVGDVVYLVTYLYRGGPAPIPMVCVGDVNNNDIVDVGDLVYLVAYLYKGGPAPDPNCCNPAWKHSGSNSTPHGEHRWAK